MIEVQDACLTLAFNVGRRAYRSNTAKECVYIVVSAVN